MRIEINVLGPLEFAVGGVSVVPSAGKPSQVLTMLALSPGQAVAASALADEIWDGMPPRSATSTLHTYILRLRKSLQKALAEHTALTPKDIVITRRSGYLLDVAADDVDAFRYEQLSSAGRQAANEGDLETASRTLGMALRLWRGNALADVTTGPRLAIEATRLEENRLGDQHLRIDAELRMGRHHQLLGELATLCAQHPLLESFYAQHMVALYRSGRQSQALDVYRRLRANMVDRLGIEPSPRVRQLHRAILTGRAETDDPNFVLRG